MQNGTGRFSKAVTEIPSVLLLNGNIEINGVSVRTAYNELKDLVDKGFLVTEGRGRSVRYLPRK